MLFTLFADIFQPVLLLFRFFVFVFFCQPGVTAGKLLNQPNKTVFASEYMKDHVFELRREMKT